MSAVGTNLTLTGQLSNNASEQPFLNLCKLGQGWYTLNSSNADNGEEATLYSSHLDANGYPTSLSFGTTTKVFFQCNFVIGNSGGLVTYPYLPGNYIFLYDGSTGSEVFSFGGDASVVSGLGTGRVVLNVATPNVGIYITYGPGPAIATNFRLVYSPYESLLAGGEIFNPDFITRITPFKTLRFMDWLSTVTLNQTPTVTWGNRNTQNWVFWNDNRTSSTPQTNAGIPIEVCIALCNEIGADGYFNVPFLADDTYIANYASLVHSNLNSNLSAYVEYGNELWNGVWGTGVGAQLTTNGKAIFSGMVPGTDQQYAWQYGIRQMVRCGLIWKSTWGADAGRVHRVLGGQNTGDSSVPVAGGWSSYVIATNSNDFSGPTFWESPLAGSSTGTAAQNSDFLCVAPYFGQAYYTYTAGISVSNTFVELLSGGVVSGGYPGGECLEVINAFTENYNIATAVGLRLISYEGGNNLGGGVNGATFLTCQTDSRMTTVYDTILNAWFALSNIGPFIHYTDIADINSAGAYWGALVNVQQTTSIKYAALLSFITPPPSPPTAVIPIPMGQAWM